MDIRLGAVHEKAGQERRGAAHQTGENVRGGAVYERGVEYYVRAPNELGKCAAGACTELGGKCAAWPAKNERNFLGRTADGIGVAGPGRART